MNKYTLCSQIKEITSFEFSKFEINFPNYGRICNFLRSQRFLNFRNEENTYVFQTTCYKIVTLVIITRIATAYFKNKVD